MTVSYNLDVASSATFSFARLLFRWKGSVWKSVYKELFVWLILYYITFFIYRFVLDEEQQDTFGRLSEGCNRELEFIPLTFLLGFFVSLIVSRWTTIFNNMGWIESCALMVSNFFRGSDKTSVLERRTIIRYLVLSQILVLRNISMKVRRRFPNYEAIIRAGFMTAEERDLLTSVDSPYNKYWVPAQWALVICYRKYENDSIQVGFYNNAITEIKLFRSNLAMLVNYDWVPLPLAYPQVVFLAVRSYFLVCVVSRQFILRPSDPTTTGVDIYVPAMTIIQLIFLVGWMKVAEALLNPMGEDDDDFECNFLIDKNLSTGMAIVDGAYDKCPNLKEDMFMDPHFFKPHKQKKNFVEGSVAKVKVKCASEDDQTEKEEQKPKTLRERLETIFRNLLPVALKKTAESQEAEEPLLRNENVLLTSQISIPDIILRMPNENRQKKPDEMCEEPQKTKSKDYFNLSATLPSRSRINRSVTSRSFRRYRPHVEQYRPKYEGMTNDIIHDHVTSLDHLEDTPTPEGLPIAPYILPSGLLHPVILCETEISRRYDENLLNEEERKECDSMIQSCYADQLRCGQELWEKLTEKLVAASTEAYLEAEKL